jgi:hypothetical protein
LVALFGLFRKVFFEKLLQRRNLLFLRISFISSSSIVILMKFIRLLIVLALGRCKIARNPLIRVILDRFWGLFSLVGRGELIFLDIIKVEFSVLFL